MYRYANNFTFSIDLLKENLNSLINVHFIKLLLRLGHIQNFSSLDPISMVHWVIFENEMVNSHHGKLLQ